METQVPKRRPVLLAAASIVLAGFAVYAGSFSGVFLFDDVVHVTTNLAIRHVWPLWDVIKPGAGYSCRPLVSLSLALNYAVGSLDVTGYHLFNLTVHLLAGLVLFGVVRRTLAGPRLAARFARAATLSAAVVAVAWTVHPLQTESVTYIIQRAESMMALFYLLTLYCFIRATTPGARSRPWLAASVAASALGMCSKEVMATVPLAVLLYDRAFLSSSFAEALRRRRIFYAALAATLLILLGLALLSPPLDTVGFHLKDRSVHDYALTQAHIITSHYLRLVFWPLPLVLDYNLAPVPSVLAAGLPALFTLFLLAATIFLYRRAPALAFPLAWFFLVLAPTSSVIPVADLVFEHRMYLPLAGVLALLVLPVALVRGKLLRVLVLAGLTGYVVFWGALTYDRNRDYESDLVIWSATVRKVPGNARAWNNKGNSLQNLGQGSKAMACFDKALEIDPTYARAWNNKGVSLNSLGRSPEAIACFDKATEIDPRDVASWVNKGNSLNILGRSSEALACLDKALAINPRNVKALNNKGDTLNRLGRPSEAIGCFDRILKIDPRYARAWNNEGNSWDALDRPSEAMACYDHAVDVNPRYAIAWYNKARIHEKLGDRPAAIRCWHTYLEVARQDPAQRALIPEVEARLRELESKQ